MPRRYARAGYSKRKKQILPYGIYQVAKSAAREARAVEQKKRIADAIGLFADAGGLATGNVDIRRTAAKVAGRGMYTGAGKYGIRKALGEFAKRNHIGQRVFDATAGRLLGGGMYTGTGEYEGPDSNDLLSSKSTMDVVPLFNNSDPDDAILYSRREYVSEIYGPPLDGAVPKPFVLQEFQINPGLEKTFPWLSQIAANFDEYEMVQLCFTFKSTTTESGNQTNGQVGTVIMATNYNSAAASFTEKFTMMQYAHAVSCRLTESLQAFVECDPEKLSGSRGEYVRTNPVVSNQDLKTYDHGKFQIAIANCSKELANQSLGELWVTYTVKLRKPKFFTGKGLSISKDIFLANPVSSIAERALLGSNTLKGQQNNIGILTTTPAANTIRLTFPAAYSGFLRIMLSMDADNFNLTNAVVFSKFSGNIELVADIYGTGDPNTIDAQPQIFNKTFAAGATVAATISFIAIAHIKVDIATNGTDNVLSILAPPLTLGGYSAVYLEATEYNSGFSYKANNVGTSNSPIWVDTKGIVTAA